MKKTFYVIRGNLNGKSIWKGTIEELVDVFSYTLLCGNSWDRTINKNPRTINSLINNLNKSCSVCRRYNDYYNIGTQEQWDSCKPDVGHSRKLED